MNVYDRILQRGIHKKMEYFGNNNTYKKQK